MFYLYDGALSGEEREDAEIHLKRCAECRRAIADWRALSGVVFRPQTVLISPDFSGRVMSRIKAEECEVPGFFRRLRPYFSIPRLAAGAVAVALLIFISRPFLSLHSESGIEGTAFVAELFAGDTAEADSYAQASHYILGS